MSHTVETKYKGFEISYLENVFNDIKDSENWKNPIDCTCPLRKAPAIFAAIAYYHADIPVVVGFDEDTSHIIIKGNGYQAW